MTDTNVDETPAGTADRIGLKLASAFQPTRTLRIIPSVTFYDYAGEDRDILNIPDRQYGLRTVFGSFNSPWSMSMMLRYAEQDDFRNLLSPYNR